MTAPLQCQRGVSQEPCCEMAYMTLGLLCRAIDWLVAYIIILRLSLMFLRRWTWRYGSCAASARVARAYHKWKLRSACRHMDASERRQRRRRLASPLSPPHHPPSPENSEPLSPPTWPQGTPHQLQATHNWTSSAPPPARPATQTRAASGGWGRGGLRRATTLGGERSCDPDQADWASRTQGDSREGLAGRRGVFWRRGGLVRGGWGRGVGLWGRVGRGGARGGGGSRLGGLRRGWRAVSVEVRWGGSRAVRVEKSSEDVTCETNAPVNLCGVRVCARTCACVPDTLLGLRV